MKNFVHQRGCGCRTYAKSLIVAPSDIEFVYCERHRDDAPAARMSISDKAAYLPEPKPIPPKPGERVDYDREADCLYVQLRNDARVTNTVAFGPGRHVDLTRAGNVAGLEFLNVSGGIDLRDMPCAGYARVLIVNAGLGHLITDQRTV